MSSLEDIISELSTEDLRYRPGAYQFLYEALDYTQKKLRSPGHISGKQLLEGIRQFALERFGLMAQTVFQEWGIRETKDFGNIVFNLVEKKAMGKTDKDRLEDFIDIYDFENALSNVDVLKKEWKIRE